MGHQSRLNPFAGKQKQDPIIPTGSFDRMGRPLAIGDVVYIIAQQDVEWRIQDLKPVLDPGAPPGLVQITFTAGFVTGVPGGQRLMDVIKLKAAPPVEPPVEGWGEEHNSAGPMDPTDVPEIPSGPRRIAE